MRRKQQGFALIELLIAIAFISILTVVILSATSFADKAKVVARERFQATLQAQAALEAIHQVDWSEIATGTFHPVLVDQSWQLASGPETIDEIFSRSLIINSVYRASTTNGQVFGEIVETPGYIDPNTYLVTASIQWDSKRGGTFTEEIDTYIHRWSADRWGQTDWSGGGGQEDFIEDDKFDDSDPGIDYDTPGIISLAIGNIDWSNATTTGFYNTPGNFDDNDVVADGNIAYLVSENNPSDAELYILDVSNISSPFLISSLDVGASLSGVSYKDGYLFVSSDDNIGEFKVIDVNDVYNPTVVYTNDLTGNNNGTDVAVNASEAYLLQEGVVHSFDISSPASPVILDEVALSDLGNKLFIAGNYLYVATQDASAELQIVDITNPANLQVISTIDLGGSVKANDVFVLGSQAYVTTDNSGSSAEFYILDVSDPFNPFTLGDYEIGETVFALVVIGDFALVGTNFNDEELIILDVSTPATISNVGNYDLYGRILGMTTNCSTIYAATSGNQGEFFIIDTGVPECTISTSGSLESSTFDTGSDQVEYNWISWSEIGTANTIIKMQIATSESPTGPWNYLGPDGTGTSFYTDSAQEPINYSAHLNQRYLRYMVFLETLAAYDVPIVEDITISYSAY